MAAFKENFYFQPLIRKNTSYEVRVTGYQLRVESLKAREIREFKSTSSIWWIHKLPVYIYELQVHIHELRVQILTRAFNLPTLGFNL